MAWQTFKGISSGKKSDRYFGFAATKLRALTPSHQFGWTQNHIPLKPVAKTLHQLFKERIETKP